jgi:hypothetical protein
VNTDRHKNVCTRVKVAALIYGLMYRLRAGRPGFVSRQEIFFFVTTVSRPIRGPLGESCRHRGSLPGDKAEEAWSWAVTYFRGQKCMEVCLHALHLHVVGLSGIVGNLMSMLVFWVIMPCGLVGRCRRFGAGNSTRRYYPADQYRHFYLRVNLISYNSTLLY